MWQQGRLQGLWECGSRGGNQPGVHAEARRSAEGQGGCWGRHGDKGRGPLSIRVKHACGTSMSLNSSSAKTVSVGGNEGEHVRANSAKSL